MILDFQINSLSLESYSLDVFERNSFQVLASVIFNHRVDFLSDFSIERLNASTQTAAERFDELQKLGSTLYQKLFSPPVENVWKEYKQQSDFLVLCLRIAENASGLEMLPWETLYDGAEFIAAGAKTTLTRLPLDVPYLDAPAPIQPPVRLFGIFASPLDLSDGERLNIEREKEILLEAINDPAGQGHIFADFEDEAKPQILARSLREGYHIIHFTGHGISPRDGGGLLLEDADGTKLRAASADVLEMLQGGVDKLRLTVLSGCQTARTLHAGAFSDLSRALLRRHVPAVIAMQFSISDEGGLKFAEVFYREVAKGAELERAVHAARLALLEDKRFFINNDALSIILLTVNGACLRTTETATALSPIESGANYLGDRLDDLQYGFYGRRREYRKIRDALQHKRAVIIHGIGGIGKTALLTHAIYLLRPRFKEVFSFDCRRTLGTETILLEFHRYFETHGNNQLGALIGQGVPPETLAEEIATLLAQWPLLVVFDNFESLIQEQSEIIDKNLSVFLKTLVILMPLSGSRFLFTTRYLFNVDSTQAEHFFALPLGDLSRAEALMLMQKLPHLSQATHQEKLSVMEKFGCHPYALIALDRYYEKRPLSNALHDVDLLQSQLREFLAVELNYGQLPERARELLDKLAAFRNTVSSAAAVWVLGKKAQLEPERVQWFLSRPAELPESLRALDDDALLDLLTKLPERREVEWTEVFGSLGDLIRWGLVTPTHVDGEIQTLSVHSLVRDFCREQRSNEWRRLLLDAAAFFTNETRVIPNEHKTEEIVWVEMEGFELLVDGEDFVGAVGLLRKVQPLLEGWGYGRYVENQYYRIIDKLDTADVALTRHDLGLMSQSRGGYKTALRNYQLSFEAYQQIGDREGAARCLHQIGRIHQARGEYDEALRQHQLSLEMREQIGERQQTGRSLHQIGAVHQARGDLDAALHHYQLSLKVFEEIDERMDAAHELYYIGTIHMDRGDLDAALKQHQHALKLREEIGERGGIMNSLHRVGQIYLRRGEYDESLKLYDRLLKLSEGSRKEVAVTLQHTGQVHHARGDYDIALEYFTRALTIYEELDDRLGIANSSRLIGLLHRDCDHHDAALEHLTRARRIHEELGNRAGLAEVLQDLAGLHQIRGNFDAALQQYRYLSTIMEEMDSQRNVPAVLFNMGRIHFARGDVDAAQECFTRAHAGFEELGERRAAATSLSRLGDLSQVRGDYDAALEQHQLALKTYHELGDHIDGGKSFERIGIIYQARGDCDTALEVLQQALGIYEELGHRAGVAGVHGTIGAMFGQNERYAEALRPILFALSETLAMKLPTAHIHGDNLRALRANWGGEQFDAAWEEETGEPVPEGLKQTPNI